MATPHKQPFTGQQKAWIKMVVAGASRREILLNIFGVDMKKNPELVNRCDQKMFRWRKHPDYDKEWNKAYREIWGEITQEALRELKAGLHDKKQPWRRTQHVNMVLSYGSKIVSGEENSTVHVKIEGMPELGSPDQEDG